MLLIGNGCFGELSIILRVTMVCVFFHSIYNNISTRINCPDVDLHLGSGPLSPDAPRP